MAYRLYFPFGVPIFLLQAVIQRGCRERFFASGNFWSKIFEIREFFLDHEEIFYPLRTAVWIDNRKYFRTGRRGGLDVMATNARL